MPQIQIAFLLPTFLVFELFPIALLQFFDVKPGGLFCPFFLDCVAFAFFAEGFVLFSGGLYALDVSDAEIALAAFLVVVRFAFLFADFYDLV